MHRARFKAERRLPSRRRRRHRLLLHLFVPLAPFSPHDAALRSILANARMSPLPIQSPPLSSLSLFHCFLSTRVRIRHVCLCTSFSSAFLGTRLRAVRGGAFPPPNSLDSLLPRILTTLDLDLFFHRGIRGLDQRNFGTNGIRWAGVRRVLEISRGFDLQGFFVVYRDVFVDVACGGLRSEWRVVETGDR